MLSGALALFYAGIIFPPEVDRTITHRVLWDGSEPYHGELSADGRYLFLTHCYHFDSAENGLTKLDLVTGESSTIFQEFPNGHYLASFTEQNLVVVTNFRDEEPSDLCFFSISPFQKLHCSELLPDYVRPYRYQEKGLVVLNVSGKYFYVPDVAEAAARSSTAPLLESFPEIAEQQIPAELGLFIMLPLPHNPSLAWMIGEWEFRLQLIDVAENRIEKTAYLGLDVWDAAIDPQSNNLILSRSWWRKVDFRDAGTGEHIDTLHLRGIPRAVVADPGRRLVFVGLYFGGRIAVIDLDTHRLVEFIPTCAGLRFLQIDKKGENLIAIGKQVISYPLKQFRK